MKIGKALWITAPALIAGLLALPAFAQSNSYSSTNTTSTPANDGSSTTTTTTTNGGNTGNSWQASAGNTAHNAKADTENAYEDVKHDVKDVSLEARVKTMLHEDKFTRGSDVHVSANHGVVTLTGRVPTSRTARHAQQLVADVYGVKAVSNELHYRDRDTTVTPADSESTGVAHPAYNHNAPAERTPENQ